MKRRYYHGTKVTDIPHRTNKSESTCHELLSLFRTDEHTADAPVMEYNKSDNSLTGGMLSEGKKVALLKVVASGFFGTVWNTKYAYVVKTWTYKDPSVARENINHEISTHIKLFCHCPEIVPIIYFVGVYRDANGHWNGAIGMERLKGGTLSKFVHDNMMEKPSLVITVMMKVCDTMAWLQKQIRFMHRDMYGRNIMLRQNRGVWTPVWIDFGFSCIGENTCHGNHRRYPKYVYNNTQDLAMLFASFIQYECRVDTNTLFNNPWLRALTCVTSNINFPSKMKQNILDRIGCGRLNGLHKPLYVSTAHDFETSPSRVKLLMQYALSEEYTPRDTCYRRAWVHRNVHTTELQK
jgi:serine/threonine protein kinase